MKRAPFTAAIIVAAGQGARAGGDVPKQWRLLSSKRVVDRTLDAFRLTGDIDRIVLVVHPGALDRAAEFPDVMTIAGGATRTASVRAGLEALKDQNIGRVLIHDVARPLVSSEIIADVLAQLDVTPGAAPALAVTDALWRGADGTVTGTQDRAGLFRAQTPQAFRFDAILAAHRAYSGTAADDVEIARAAGMTVAMVPGSERNLKLTWPTDFERAETLIGAEMDIRVGSGFDVHRFGPGDHVMLCGVAVPHSHGLLGHSDADVAMHAATDAIYGALAQGDIGRHFPPSDPKWQGAASAVFLRHAMGVVAKLGFRVSNIDVTIICEHPKIAPYAKTMTEQMAEIMEISESRISIKATTSEGLGFTGRKEGIAAQAVATCVKS